MVNTQQAAVRVGEVKATAIEMLALKASASRPSTISQPSCSRLGHTKRS